MKRTTSAALAAVTISSLAFGATAAGASVSAKADPQKVCKAIASEPETPKQELAAIRLAQSGENPELTKPLAVMEKAAEKAVKSKKSGATETEAYNAALEKVFKFGYDECSDTQFEATFGATGFTDVPTTVDAGDLGVKVTNETDGDIGFGVIHVLDGNTATTDEIIAAVFASDDAEPEGIEFVSGGGAPAGETGFGFGNAKAGRYLLVAFSEADDATGPAGVAEFTVS